MAKSSVIFSVTIILKARKYLYHNYLSHAYNLMACLQIFYSTRQTRQIDYSAPLSVCRLKMKKSHLFPLPLAQQANQPIFLCAIPFRVSAKRESSRYQFFNNLFVSIVKETEPEFTECKANVLATTLP